MPHHVHLILVLLLSSFRACESFSTPTPKTCRRRRGCLSCCSPLAPAEAHRVEQVLTDDRVLDVASFRNGLCNPTMMVERQQAKQDSVDRTKAAVDGLKIGLFFVGPPFAIYQWYSTGSIQDGLLTYGMYMTCRCVSDG